MASGMSAPSSVRSTGGNGKNYTTALVLLTSLFFMWGFITCLNDIIIPHFKAIFELSYTKTMLVQFTFFTAFAIMSLPAGWLVGKIGYQKGIVTGLSVTGLGALIFYPASFIISYEVFLAGLFVLATGITILQVSANPFVAILGSAATASSRLNLTQSFNSLGTTIAPLLGSLLILGGTYFNIDSNDDVHLNPEKSEIASFDEKITPQILESDELKGANLKSVVKDHAGNIWFEKENTIEKYDGESFETYTDFKGTVDQSFKGFLVEEKVEPHQVHVVNDGNYRAFQEKKSETVRYPYLGIAAVLFLLAIVFAKVKLPVIEEESYKKGAGSAWQFTHLVLGALAIFMYVGAEVSIGSFLISFFSLSDIGGLTEAEAAKFVSLYWGGAMVGRFFGAVTLSDMPANKRNIWNAVIFVISFLLALYLTKDLTLSGIFLIFVIINMGAFYIGKNVPARTLAVFAGTAMILVILTVVGSGQLSMYTIVAVGLFNSIMFPTIFTLAIDGLGEHRSQGSGILCMAIVGGALIPLIMGALADTIGVHMAFMITIICYAYILFYGIKGHKHTIKN